MKKILFSVALLMGGMAVASAQNLTSVEKIGGRLSIIPQTFTVDKQAKAVAFSSEESEGAVETNSFTIFGKGFSVAREFSYNSNLLKEYTLVEYRTPEITVRDTSEYDTTYDILLGLGKYNEVGEIDTFYQLSIDDCIAYIENISEYIDSTYTDNDGCTYFITHYLSHNGISEKNYPERYYYLKGRKLYNVNISYGNTRYTGDWTSEETDVHYYTSGSEIENYVGYTNADSDTPTDEFWTILTQTLFNDDDKYEFFVTKRKVEKEETRESDYDNDGIKDHKETRYSAKITALEIVSEDGSVLNSIPTGGDIEGITIYTFNGENYLALFYYEEENYTQLYRIDKGSSSLQEVAMPAGMKMFPTIARPSDEIAIEFEASAGNAVRTLSVIDAAGRTVEQRTVAPNASRITVSARRLHAGTYIFTLTENGKQVDNGKIIVK